MSKILALLCCIFATSLQANEWRDEDNDREIVYMAFHAIDWAQTIQIAANPVKYHEQNPIMGRQPNTAQVNTYFAITAAAHVAISYVLPNDWRTAWQYITIGVEVEAIRNNLSLGIKIPLN